MSVIDRLADKVARQEEKVAKETERLEIYREQLQTAMYSTFVKRQQSSHLSFDEALDQAFGKQDKPSRHIIDNRNEERK